MLRSRSLSELIPPLAKVWASTTEWTVRVFGPGREGRRGSGAVAARVTSKWLAVSTPSCSATSRGSSQGMP